MFRRGLFWKIFGACVLLIVLTSVVAGWTASRRLADDAEQDTKTRIETQVLLVRELLTPGLPAALDPAFQARVQTLGKETGTRLTVVRADGFVLADSSKDPVSMDNHATRPEIERSATQAFGHSIRESATLGMPMVYVATRVESPGGTRAVIRGALPLLELEDRQLEIQDMVIQAALISLVLGLLVAVFIAQRLARPLRTMSEAALAIAAGDFARRVPAHSADEVGALGNTFNMMAKRLQTEVGTINRERGELRAILEGMVEGVIAVDADERIVLMNDAAGAMFDLDPRKVRGERIWEVLRWSKVPATLADAVRSGDAVGTEVGLMEDGHERTVRLHVSPQASDDGARRGAVVVLEDVTDRRRLEAVRRDFIANASHELKTPVAAIRGLVETIIEDPDMDALTRQGFLERVLRQSDRLGGVVEEMLSLSRLESGPLDVETPPQDIRGSVREAVDDAGPLAAEHGVGISMTIADEPLLVRGMPGAVRRVVGNLLDNAIKYSAPESRVLVRAYLVGDHVEIAVTDRGQGIPLEKQERVFERFYRVDEGRARDVGGTGLGLAIVKHLVQSMGGEVRIDSQPGVGSTFRVVWPSAESRPRLDAPTPVEG